MVNVLSFRFFFTPVGVLWLLGISRNELYVDVSWSLSSLMNLVVNHIAWRHIYAGVKCLHTTTNTTNIIKSI